MTAKVPVIDLKGKETGQREVLDSLFAIEPVEAAVHFVCKGQQFRYYKKTAKTKGRSEVNGGGKKARKQKGSGQGRQGGNRAPHWVGGGVVFGPKGEKRDFKINRKVKRLAFASALSDRYSGGQIRVLGAEVSDSKTKPLADLLKALKLSDAKVGFVVSESTDFALIKSIRNLDRVDVLTEERWTPLDIVRTDSVIFSEGALEKLTTRFEAEGAKS